MADNVRDFVVRSIEQYHDKLNTDVLSTLPTDVQVNGTSVVSNNVANIPLKTINNTSLVGTGNISIEGSSSSATGNYVSKSGDTMNGELTAYNGTNYTTPYVRNILMSTDIPDNSIGGNGDIWIVYVE